MSSLAKVNGGLESEYVKTDAVIPVIRACYICEVDKFQISKLLGF